MPSQDTYTLWSRPFALHLVENLGRKQPMLDSSPPPSSSLRKCATPRSPVPHYGKPIVKQEPILAQEYLSAIIGLSPKPISHVLGHASYGAQLAHEARTTIIALMRVGEPMAFGVNDVFPQARFLHAKPTSDVNLEHLDGQHTVILVDSVISTGKSVVEFVKHIRHLHDTIRIVVVAGVVQDQAVAPQNPESLHHRLAGVVGVSLFALRTSKTKFAGSGTTDTGNRLSNTTHTV